MLAQPIPVYSDFHRQRLPASTLRLESRKVVGDFCGEKGGFSTSKRPQQTNLPLKVEQARVSCLSCLSIATCLFETSHPSAATSALQSQSYQRDEAIPGGLTRSHAKAALNSELNQLSTAIHCQPPAGLSDLSFHSLPRTTLGLQMALMSKPQ